MNKKIKTSKTLNLIRLVDIRRRTDTLREYAIFEDAEGNLYDLDMEVIDMMARECGIGGEPRII